MVKKAIKSNWARTEGNLSEALVKSLTIDGTEKEGEVMRPRDKLPSMCFVARTQEGKVQGSTLICIGIADYKMDLDSRLPGCGRKSWRMCGGRWRSHWRG